MCRGTYLQGNWMRGSANKNDISVIRLFLDPTLRQNLNSFVFHDQNYVEFSPFDFKSCDQAKKLYNNVPKRHLFPLSSSPGNAATLSILLMGYFNQQATQCCPPVLYAKIQCYEIASQWLWVWISFYNAALSLEQLCSEKRHVISALALWTLIHL